MNESRSFRNAPAQLSESVTLFGPDCVTATTVSRWTLPISDSSVISASARIELVVASQPGNSMPASLRTVLRPPSHPTTYCARNVRSSSSTTSTPSASCVNAVTPHPRWTCTPTSSAHPRRISSKRFWNRASPCGRRVGRG